MSPAASLLKVKRGSAAETGVGDNSHIGAVLVFVLMQDESTWHTHLPWSRYAISTLSNK